MPSETVHIFTREGILEKVKRGIEIFKEGSVGKSFYLLLSGRVSVKKKGKKIAELKQGDFFGEIALIANTPRSATIRTLEETLVLRLDQEPFWKILAENFELALSLENIAEARLWGKRA